MATFNSQIRREAKYKFASAIFIFGAAGIVFAGEPQNKIFAARVEAEFHGAQKQFQSDTNNSADAWQFARACFDFADFATNKIQRATIAREGISACRQSLARTNSAAAHYYLAMNSGQLARAEFIGALRLVREMEREFKTAADLDAQFDFAGPERCLGLLYRDAPRWPVSIGSKTKSRTFLEQAEKLAPDFPENRLNLAESYLKWNQPGDARLELNALDSLWSKEQASFTGEIWERDWNDWSTRRDAARKKLAEFFASPEANDGDFVTN